ncbi:DNRLRE domain-containing protein [Planomonospora sp. ID91781]|uniref:RHS repeat-associated core domain-containing protein n=1 Tax=Planomonospora sp. ID91781 TaxID=2738135 RepID=UPI0018C36E37|nr:RHS repeat-associated core domain-containing protein [Planomonospora sp. ID91781]MBG0825910.1 DNRLRE domain-containing protein [Planomonospora sp. ID91781]
MVTLRYPAPAGPGLLVAAARPILLVLVTLLAAGSGTIVVTGPTRAPMAPAQVWGSAAGQPHLLGTARNTSSPQTLRARYPLTRLDGTAKAPATTATVTTAPTPVMNPVPPETGRELPGERSAYSRSYANPDGTLTSEFSTTPLNYRQADGSWAPINTRLASTGEGWRNTADSVDVRLASRAAPSGMVRLGLDPGHEIAYGVRDGVAARAKAGTRGVTYPGVWPHADVRVDVLPGGVKETIVLRSPGTSTVFDFPLELKGLTAATTADGRVVFTDGTGRERAVVPAGSMTDSAARPATSAGVTYSLRTEGGRPVLRVSADRSWLAAPGRVYPVLVDPSVEISAADTSLSVGDGHSTGGGQELTVGRRSAAYLAFPQLDDELRYHRVFGAYLWMVNYDSSTCRSRPVTVHPVTEAWSGQSGLSYPGPAVGSSLARRSFSHGYIALGSTTSKCPTDAVSFNLGKAGRDLIQRWVDGRQANYGLSVRDASSGSDGTKKFTGHDTKNPPRLIVTHSPYDAAYRITKPVPDPPVTQAQSGKIKITVTNKGAQTWTAGSYYLAYRVYDKKGKLVTQQRSANLTQSVVRNGKVTLDATIKALKPGTYSIDFTMARAGGPVFIDEMVPPVRLILTVIDIPPVLQELYPSNGYQAQTLTPQLWATAVDLDPSAGSALSYKFEVCKSTESGGVTDCFDSGYVPTRAWSVPAGKLSWQKTYVWRVFVKDTGSEVPSPRQAIITAVPQPEITSRLAGADGDRDFDPQSGNLGSRAVDAPVATAGPELAVERTYNSLDPRRDGAFGAGWATVYDMRLTPEASGSVVIGYPDGRQVRYGKNPDGTYAPPPGRYATLRFDSSSWKLTDKSGTTYEFANSRLSKITDVNGHALVLTYNTADGKLAKATSRPGERSLTFTWSGAHVASVSTDPVAGKRLTWTYTYSGDLLTQACAPGARCTSYEYAPGSHYRSGVLDSKPESYYRFGEEEGSSAASQIAVNLGKDTATYQNVAFQAAGAIAGTHDTAAGFNGTSSSVSLPSGAVKRSHELAVELWFKNLSTGAGGPLLGYQDKPLGTTPGTGVPVLYVGTDGRLRGQFADGAISPITSTALVNDGKWHHAVLSATGSTQTLYLDGKVAGTLTGRTPQHLAMTYNQAGAAHVSTPASWPAWGTAARRHYAGTIDEVAVYLHPLGPDSVAAHYREGTRAADQLAKVTLPSGKVAAEADYDAAQDRVTEYTDAHGGTWTIGLPVVYGGDSDIRRAVEVRDPAGQSYLYEYDALAARIVRQGIPLGLGTRDDDVPVTPTPTPTPTFTCAAPDPGDPSFCTTLPGGSGDAPDFIRQALDGMAIRTFGYNDQGFPSAITNENGDTTRFTYDKRGNPLTRTTCRAKDACHTTYYTYPAVTSPSDPRNDRPTEVRDGRSSGPADNRYRTSFAYSAAGNLLTQTNPSGGGQLAFVYTNGTEGAIGGGTMPSGLVLTETDPRGAVTSYAYTAAGDVAQVTTPSGLRTTFTTDAIGRVVSRTEVSDSVPAGATTTYGYDDWSNLTSVTYPAAVNAVTGATTQKRVDNSFDVDGNLLRWQTADIASGGETRTIGYDYDDHNLLERATDSLGNETAYVHDVFGNTTAVVDATGARFDYAYTARNVLAEVRLADVDGDLGGPDGGGTLVLNSYAYDYAGRLVRETDAMGRRIETAYYGDDLVKSTTLKDMRTSGGATRDFVLSAFEYDGAGNLLKETTDNGTTVTEYTVDAMGRTTAATLDPGGLTRRTAYQYDLGGNLTRVAYSGTASNVDWTMPTTPETTIYAYDPAGRLTKKSVTDGTTTLTTSYAYDQRDLTTAVTEPRGNVAGADKDAYTTTMAYDVLGRLTVTTEPPVQTESLGGPPSTVRPRTVTGYNAFGDTTEVKDPLGAVNRVGYDRLGQPVTMTSPSYTPPGSTTPIVPSVTLRYNPAGQIQEAVDPLGKVTRYDYDRLGRVRTMDTPTGDGERAVWRYTYTATGEMLSATDPAGARTEATYDDLGRIATKTQIERRPAAATYTTRYAYDDASNLLSSAAPSGATTTHAYDGADELVRTTDPAGVVTRFGYDHRGRLVRESDGLGRTVRHVYDLLGRLTGQHDLDPAGSELRKRSYTYDAAGNLTEMTDALGRVTTFSHDAAGRIVKQVEPVTDSTSITTTYGYDAAGNRTRFTDGRGNATVYTTNTLSLPESVIEPATAAHPAAADRTWTITYNAAGDPVKETAPGGVVRQRVFDDAHRLVKESGSGTTATPDRVLAYDLSGHLTRAASGADADVYTYGDRGLLLSAQGPSGSADLTYDADGLLIARTDAAGTATFDYLDGRLNSARDGITGVTRTYSYDAAGRPQTVAYGTQATRRLGYDEFGRPASDTLTDVSGKTVASATYTYDKEDRTTGEQTTGLAGAGSDTYGYDQAGRLTSWTRDGATVRYAWDAAGNRTDASGATATFDERNRRLSDGQSTYAYTPRGTLTSASGPQGQRSYAFDAFDRMVGAGPIGYTYDGLDRPATRDGARWSYAGTGSDPVSDGTFRYARDPAGDLLAYGQGGSARIALADKHGDQVGGFAPGTTLTGLNDSSAYDPFGRTIATQGSGSPIGYQGDWTDPGTGHVTMGARWYDPQAGAFDSRDALTLDAVPDSGEANRYAYAGGTPLDATDPSGHCSVRTKLSADCLQQLMNALRYCTPRNALTWLYKFYYFGGGSLFFRLPPIEVWFGLGGGSSGGGGSGPSGPSRAEQAAAARAHALAKARARTKAAKERAEQEAKERARTIQKGLRQPEYADPKQRIPGTLRRPSPVISGKSDVIRDTTRSLWDMRGRAVREAGDVVRPPTPAAMAPPESLPVTVPDVGDLPDVQPSKARVLEPRSDTQTEGGGAEPPGRLRVAGDMCDEDEIFTSVGCEDPLDTLERVVNGLRDRFAKNPDDMRRYLSQPEMDAALKPKKGFLGRMNVGKAIEKAAARHPDIQQHFVAVGGRDMPDFVALRTMRMYEVTTNSPSAFFNHINRGYVDPTAYIGYKQVPFGTGLLPRLPQPGIIEPKFPFPPGAGP